MSSGLASGSSHWDEMELPTIIFSAGVTMTMITFHNNFIQCFSNIGFTDDCINTASLDKLHCVLLIVHLDV